MPELIHEARSGLARRAPKRLIQKISYVVFRYLAGFVVDDFSGGIHNYHVGNQVAVIAVDQCLLGTGKLVVQINNDKVDAIFIFVVETDGAASLPLGVESTLFKDENVVDLALGKAGGGICASDQGSILAVAVVVKVRVQLEFLCRQPSCQ